MNSKIGSGVPNKRALITNLLNRVDGRFVSVKTRTNKNGVEFSLENENTRLLAASKQILKELSYMELEALMKGETVANQFIDISLYTLNKFEPKVEKEKPAAVVATSIKSVDHNANGYTSDFGDENRKRKPGNKPAPKFKDKRPSSGSVNSRNTIKPQGANTPSRNTPNNANNSNNQPVKAKRPRITKKN